jgi:hypothetical protein
MPLSRPARRIRSSSRFRVVRIYIEMHREGTCDNRRNPIRDTSTRAAVHRYKVEPYVVCADVYAVPPHVGRVGRTRSASSTRAV